MESDNSDNSNKLCNKRRTRSSLTRDSSGHKSCFNFTAESSDNNSVILEGGSSTNHVGILRIKDTNSGYFENGAKELESDDSVDGINDNNNFGKQNLVGVSSGKIMGTSATTSSKSKKVKGHKCPYCPRVFKSGQALGGHKRSHMMGAGRGVVKLEEKPRITRQVTVSLAGCF
uniref:C2H2-type domain-containing protein n=1 Tax=Chenopodium quinoa TaxID=63459 RepID=A0A803L7U8_CHEQI